MIRPDFLIRGFVKYKIEKEDILTAAELLLNDGISAKINVEGVMIVSVDLKRRINSLFDGSVSYTVGEVRGLPGFLLKLKKRYGIIAGLIIVFFFCIYLSGLVWDIRIEGIPEAAQEELISDLRECGFYVGASWHDIDTALIESKIVAGSEEISWINLNRRGTVAYVSAVEKEYHKPQTVPHGFSNVVSDRDCIIEDIVVKQGIAVVKVGQSVKKGDLLISGIIPTELGGGVCYAMGEVFGRFSDSVSVEISSVETVKSYGEDEVDCVSFNFFDFSVNIFKRYGNSYESCDIIEKKHALSVGEGKVLPFYINVVKACEYTLVEKSLTDSVMIERADSALKNKLSECLKDRDLIAIKTYGGFSDSGYSMCAEFICRGNVASNKEFEFNLETK